MLCGLLYKPLWTAVPATPAQRVAAEEGNQKDGPVTIPRTAPVVNEQLRPLGVILEGQF